jgi:hypothetical protein
MENVPEPVQPELPVNVQLPEIVFPAALPVNVRVFPVGVPDCTIIPKLPFTWPLKFPARVNEPVSVSPVTKHGELVVNLKFKTLTDPLLFTWSDVPKARTVELLFPMRVAFHVPLRLDGFVLFAPHPAKTKPTSTNNATANCFITESLGKRVRRARAQLVLECAGGGFGAARRFSTELEPGASGIVAECS